MNICIGSLSCVQQGHASFASGSREKDAESAAAVQILLTRWREKVFVMLVQQKLSHIYDARTKREALKKVPLLLVVWHSQSSHVYPPGSGA